MRARPLPLRGTRVVNFGVGGVAPWAASQLAQLGATVVKIEAPNEFIMYTLPPWRGLTTTYAALNANSHSVKLNLKEILSYKPRRAGFATTGNPTNVNVGRTMRNSFGRRIALNQGACLRAELDALGDVKRMVVLARRAGRHLGEMPVFDPVRAVLQVDRGQVDFFTGRRLG